MKTFRRYFKIWWLMSRNSFLAVLTQKTGFGIFLVGKILRFAFFFSFIFFLLKGTNRLAGYDFNQTLLFFLTFNLVDTISQFFFREVYRFRPLIVSGAFDLVLVKPINSLFRSLMGGADVIDLMMVPPLLFAVFWVGNLIGPGFFQVAAYILLVINGLLLAAAFHIVTLSLGIITLEIDHTIMIYRDLSSLGRFPVDIYKEPIRGILTFLVPIGIMVTFPAKAMMGLISFPAVIWSMGLGIMAVYLAVKFWNYALTKYSSASS